MSNFYGTDTISVDAHVKIKVEIENIPEHSYCAIVQYPGKKSTYFYEKETLKNYLTTKKEASAVAKYCMLTYIEKYPSRYYAIELI